MKVLTVFAIIGAVLNQFVITNADAGNNLQGIVSSELCKAALNGNMSDWSSRIIDAEAIVEAKRRNFAVSDCRRLASNQASSAQNINSTQNVQGLIASELCKEALNGNMSDWSSRIIDADAITEAKKRNLSISECKQYANSSPQAEINNSSEVDNLKRQLSDLQIQLDATKSGAQRDLDELKKRISDQQGKGNKLISADEVIISARTKLEIITGNSSTVESLQSAIRADYESKIKLQVQQLRSRLSLLNVAKVTASNSDEIKLIQAQLELLGSRTVEDEQAFKLLQAKSDDMERNIDQTKKSIEAELAKNKLELDEKRKLDLVNIESQFNDLGSVISANRTKLAKAIEDLKISTQLQVGKLKADISTLDARVADLQIQQTQTAKIATDSQSLLNGVRLPDFENSKAWVALFPSIPIQQQQFCRMIDHYRSELREVEGTKNEIKKNEVFKARQLDIANLLPNGEISNWIVRVKQVDQAKNGDAEISVSLPCEAILGSNTCNLNPDMYEGTVKPDELTYNEFAKLSVDQFVILSAKLVFAIDPNTKKSLPEYSKVQPGVHCSGSDKNDPLKSVEKFVIKPTNVVQLK